MKQLIAIDLSTHLVVDNLNVEWMYGHGKRGLQFNMETFFKHVQSKNKNEKAVAMEQLEKGVDYFQKHSDNAKGKEWYAAILHQLLELRAFVLKYSSSPLFSFSLI
jgi:hypothetical protein